MDILEEWAKSEMMLYVYLVDDDGFILSLV